MTEVGCWGERGVEFIKAAASVRTQMLICLVISFIKIGVVSVVRKVTKKGLS